MRGCLPIQSCRIEPFVIVIPSRLPVRDWVQQPCAEALPQFVGGAVIKEGPPAVTRFFWRTAGLGRLLPRESQFQIGEFHLNQRTVAEFTTRLRRPGSTSVRNPFSVWGASGPAAARLAGDCSDFRLSSCGCNADSMKLYPTLRRERIRSWVSMRPSRRSTALALLKKWVSGSRGASGRRVQSRRSSPAAAIQLPATRTTGGPAEE